MWLKDFWIFKWFMQDVMTDCSYHLMSYRWSILFILSINLVDVEVWHHVKGKYCLGEIKKAFHWFSWLGSSSILKKQDPLLYFFKPQFSHLSYHLTYIFMATLIKYHKTRSQGTSSEHSIICIPNFFKMAA